ncbi:hypothetical protein M758_9G115800 [Ceratodon purpureus]|uniref:Metallothionein n=1 Tax=Ceratodon purpureus TaxID=3225 RepID=A0A8T0GQJ7_CERPU|nr:hypothetical protein KC19_9G100300 [Ceratodon purpureus]KAG0606125.1 hypothetical protein M758_9G115800 [Ceratodon purpureus]
MSCGNGCGCCPKCGCRATCTCNQSMYFDEGMEDTCSYSVAIEDGSIKCGPYCGCPGGTGVNIGYLPGMNLRSANIAGAHFG